MELNRIVLGDAIEFLKSLPDNSVEAVITDPPYGIGVAEWDKPINIDEFMRECKRVSRDFFAFFGQMPTLADWLHVAKQHKLHYLEHVTWVKRNLVPVHAKRLNRTHEDIVIYSTGGAKLFHSTTGVYSDVKLPGVLDDAVSYESVERYINELHRWIRTGQQSMKKRSSKRQEMFDNPSRLRGDKYDPSCRLEVNFTNVWSFRQGVFQKGRAGKADYLHPNEKPVEVLKRLVEMCSPVGGTVLDPFMGSGTTAIACIETGRNFIGTEREPGYHKICLERIEKAKIQIYSPK
jgi:site-specific DNA-methyltransferase (adenine-specific)